VNKQWNLEEQILDCWGVCDDLDTLLEAVMKYDLNKEQVANILLGMRDLYDFKFSTFEEFLKKRRIKDD
jgi:hypothetical protein